MNRSMFLTLALVGLLGAPAAVHAHDASLHKGKPTKGEVTAIEDNGVQLKTAKGTMTVTFQDKTAFERRDAKAAREDIHKGDQLTVFGTKLPTGELVAREVRLPTTEAKAGFHAHHAGHSESPAKTGEEK